MLIPYQQWFKQAAANNALHNFSCFEEAIPAKRLHQYDTSPWTP